MPLRASRISLGPENPIGAQEVADLEQSDLIVIVGPNGSGKSSLLKPLQRSGSIGRLRAIDSDGQAVDFSTNGVDQTIAFITSQHLMVKIRSLGGAIALAADATRPRVDMKILDECIRQLKRDEANTPDQQQFPPELVTSRDIYLAADAECLGMARTVEHYDALGRQAASAIGVEWPGFNPDHEAGCTNEQAVAPRLQSMPGLESATKPLSELARMAFLPGDGPAHQAAKAAESLAGFLEETRRQFGIPDDRPYEIVIEWLAEGIRTTSALIAAEDHLAACRRSALEYLGAISPALGQAVGCPVCDLTVDKVAVCSTLRGHLPADPKSIDPKTKQLQGHLERITLASNDLKQLRRSSENARRHADEIFRQIRNRLHRVKDALTPAVAWEAGVAAAATVVAQEVAAWLGDHQGASSVDGESQLSRIAELASDKLQELNNHEASFRSLYASQRKCFEDLQKLGRLLRRRQDLNSIQRAVGLEAAEAAAERSSRRKEWISALTSIKDERAKSAAQARDNVLSDERIRERFTRLLGKFGDVDPWLASLVYDGSELPNHFSEGQTVLVNLAAALTVASAVIGKPGHTPGWVVLDEPTNALDSVAVERMADYLGSLGLDDLPAQMFVATFDEDFANKLVNRARKAGRRVRRISLRRFDRLAKRFDLRGDDRFLPIAHGG